MEVNISENLSSAQNASVKRVFQSSCAENAAVRAAVARSINERRAAGRCLLVGVHFGEPGQFF